MIRTICNTVGTFLISAVVLFPGCETGGAHPENESYFPPLYCDDGGDDSPTDMACREDCTRECGFTATPVNPRALKYCECEGGVFIECRCPRPDWYIGAPSAPYCDALTPDGSGLIEHLNEKPCDTEWKQCVARDAVEGFTPRGCACLYKESEADGVNGLRLEWECGSTEKWFYPDQSTIP